MTAAPAAQGARNAHIKRMRVASNAARRDASVIECHRIDE
jgi:hypothetical protein